MGYKLSRRSRKRLKGVHSDLVKVVRLAIQNTQVDFTVLEGLRSPERQQVLYDAGASATLNSRHLTGHAVDLGAYVEGKIRWDWPLYYKIAEAVEEAAQTLDVPVEWGGNWKNLKDGPHFQLPWSTHPWNP